MCNWMLGGSYNIDINILFYIKAIYNFSIRRNILYFI